MSRKVLILGGTSGIGLATAKRLVAAGDDVTVAGRNAPRTPLPGATHLALDLEHRADALAVLSQWLRDHELDLAVNSAGIQAPLGPMEDLPPGAWDRLLQINLGSLFGVMQEQLRVMKARRRGVIVNVASMWGSKPVAHAAAYVATKFGVVGLTQAAALEAAPYGVRINSVSPGFVQTPMLARAIADAGTNAEALASAVPMQRLASPDEVAAVIAWLASEASYVTGADIAVDGGMRL